MKKILLILLCLPMIGFITMIPDPNFEQKLIDLGYDNVLDGSVNTASIDTVTILDLSNWNNSPNAIFDFTGIEDFISITYLNIANNGAGVASSAVSIDISQNTALTYLDLAVIY